MLKKIIEYLQGNSGPQKTYTALELAEWLYQSYPKWCDDKRRRSSNKQNQTKEGLLKQLQKEIYSAYPDWQSKDRKLKSRSDNPRSFYYDYQPIGSEEGLAAVAETHPIALEETDSGYKTEADLYPLLSGFLRESLKVRSLRIDERCSSNSRGKNGNHWLFPDLVGLEDLTAGWPRDVKECSDFHAGKRIMLWSFEVKKKIDNSNLRESFFQAASNSSWANLGYLVAASFEGEHTMRELRILSAAHGIGVIKLDAENPIESQILIPAREREKIDWDMVARIFGENTDFRKYIENIKLFYKTTGTYHGKWDDFEDNASENQNKKSR